MKTALRLRIRLLAGLLAACCLGASAMAHADIYGYIDAEGNAHFAAAALDSRYQLFMRGNGTFDTSKIGALGGSPAADAKNAATSGHRADNRLLNYLATHPNLKKYEAMVNRAAAEFTLDPALLKAIMAAESGFNPNAVSPKGAIGLMQIMPATAQRYGMQADKKRTLQQKLTDPAINIRLAARYLRDLKNLFPQRLELMIASYNAGEGAVQKYSNQIPPYPETKNYVQLVGQFYQLYGPERSAATVQRGTPGRITMIIPGAGRRNMPAPPATAFE